MKPNEEIFIREASHFLNNPSFAVKIINTLGKPVELAIERIPSKHLDLIRKTTERALQKGLRVVSKTVGPETPVLNFSLSNSDSRRIGHWHSLASVGVGAVGGFFGVLSLPVEIPLTTSIILRSIVSIAQEFGMNVDDPEIQLECLYVLGLGSKQGVSENAYWISRLAFAKLVREAGTALATKNLGAPVLVKLLASIASRFEVVIGEKVLAEAVPVVGAVGGGLINAAFTDYFSQAARYHFGLRALESRYGRMEIETVMQRTPECTN